MKVHSVLCWLICLSLAFPASVFAATGGAVTGGEDDTVTPAVPTTNSDYSSGDYAGGTLLMPINLWGAVQKPGIHHVPLRTDLITLLSLAGGPGNDAELDHITIKRRTTGEEQILKVNAEDILSKKGAHSPTLEANDIVLVPKNKPTISNDTATTVSFVGSIVSVILAGIILANVKK